MTSFLDSPLLLPLIAIFTIGQLWWGIFTGFQFSIWKLVVTCYLALPCLLPCWENFFVPELHVFRLLAFRKFLLFFFEKKVFGCNACPAQYVKDQLLIVAKMQFSCAKNVRFVQFLTPRWHKVRFSFSLQWRKGGSNFCARNLQHHQILAKDLLFAKLLSSVGLCT